MEEVPGGCRQSVMEGANSLTPGGDGRCQLRVAEVPSSLSPYSATMSCEAVGLVSGGWGLAKLGWSVGKFAIRGVYTALPKLPVTLNHFHLNASQLSPTAQNNIRILRGWAKSKGWEKLPNPQGAPEKWGVYQDGVFEWHLSIKSECSLRPGLKDGSHVPRFDARLDTTGEQYINPFSGNTGGRQIGRHISLEDPY